MTVTACLLCLADGEIRVAPYVSRIMNAHSGRGTKVALCGEHKLAAQGKTAADLLPIEGAANATVQRLWEAAR